MLGTHAVRCVRTLTNQDGNHEGRRISRIRGSRSDSLRCPDGLLRIGADRDDERAVVAVDDPDPGPVERDSISSVSTSRGVPGGDHPAAGQQHQPVGVLAGHRQVVHRRQHGQRPVPAQLRRPAPAPPAGGRCPARWSARRAAAAARSWASARARNTRCRSPPERVVQLAAGERRRSSRSSTASRRPGRPPTPGPAARCTGCGRAARSRAPPCRAAPPATAPRWPRCRARARGGAARPIGVPKQGDRARDAAAGRRRRAAASTCRRRSGRSR